MAPNVLLLTTYPPELGKHGSDSLRSALVARGANATYKCWHESGLVPQDIISYTHIVLLSCTCYNECYNAFRAFRNDILLPAKKLNPGIHILNPETIIAWNENKTYLRDLQASGFLIPETTFVDAQKSVDALISALNERRSKHPVVVKPSVSASGLGTRLIKSPNTLTEDDKLFCAQVIEQPPGSLIMLQSFLTGIAKGELSLVFLGGHFMYAALKVPAEGEFLCQSEYGGRAKMLDESEVPEDALRVGKELLKWLERKFPKQDECVYARVDGVMGDDGRFLLMELELIEPDLGFELGAPGKAGLNALCDIILQ